MRRWDAEPFWRWYWGIADPASIPVPAPDPESAPEPVPVPAPTPEPVVPQADAAELQQKVREAEKQWNRLGRKIDRMTGRGYRWS